MSTLQKVQDCLAWAVSCGGVVDGVEVTELHGRGTSLVATSTLDCPASIHIPSSILLNRQTIEDFSRKAPAFDTICKEWSTRVPMTARRSIILLMAWSKNNSSPWSTYLEALPEYVDSPIFWSVEERKLLQGTTIAGAAEDKIAFLKAWLEYQQRHESASDFTKTLTLDELMHYEMLVDSRALLSNEDDSCMVPVIDFANHSSLRNKHVQGHQNAAWSSDANGFHLYVLPNTPGGNEILFSYGKRGNAELLFKYGFVESCQVETGSRSITLELPMGEFTAALQKSGEPSFRVMPDDDIEPLFDPESSFIWIYVLLGEDKVDWRQGLYNKKAFSKDNVLGLLQAEPQEDWQWFQFKAYSLALQCLHKQLDALDAAESDQSLQTIAQSVKADRLAMVDAVIDSERLTLQIAIQRLSDKLSKLMQNEEIKERLERMNAQ